MKVRTEGRPPQGVGSCPPGESWSCACLAIVWADWACRMLGMQGLDTHVHNTQANSSVTFGLQDLDGYTDLALRRRIDDQLSCRLCFRSPEGKGSFDDERAKR